MSFRSPYNYDTDVVSSVTSISLDPDEDRTQQSFAAECDINTLVKVYASGVPVPGADIPAMDFEIDRVIDYQTALNELRRADEAFMQLPSDVREFFQNDPAQLLDFVHTPANREKAIELGLIPTKEPATPVLVRLSEAISDATPPAAPPSES